jgi:hypothetical protein
LMRRCLMARPSKTKARRGSPLKPKASLIVLMVVAATTAPLTTGVSEQQKPLTGQGFPATAP